MLLPFPSQAQSSKLSVGRPYYQFPPPAAVPRCRSYLNSGLSSLTRDFKGRPGASKPEAPRYFKFELPIPGPWPWPCPKPLRLYSKLKPGNGTALSDFRQFLFPFIEKILHILSPFLMKFDIFYLKF